MQCPTCEERRRPQPRRQSTLETLPRKWEHVQVDTGDWDHPIHKGKHRFVMMIDEGSKFRAGVVLKGNPRKAGSWEDLRTTYEQIWLPTHGTPAVARVDPAGPWQNTQADQYFAERGVELQPIPAEAHWQLGSAENAIKSVKAVMTAIAEEFPEMTVDEVFGRSIWVCNAKDLYRGFSPLQHASGRTPDEDMRLFDSVEEKPVNGDIYEDGGFGQNIRAMCLAEKTFVDEQARQRLQRAHIAGQRKLRVFHPGDLVYYWRRQQAGREHQSFPKGRYLGPARVIATETRQEEDGHFRAGSIVWLHRSGRLLRAAPEQLRLASPREQHLEELQGHVELPWTITKLATDPKRRTFTDLVPEGNPDDMELEEHPEGPEYQAPTHRVSGKRAGSVNEQSGRDKAVRLPEPRGAKREGDTLTIVPVGPIPEGRGHSQTPVFKHSLPSSRGQSGDANLQERHEEVHPESCSILCPKAEEEASGGPRASTLS